MESEYFENVFQTEVQIYMVKRATFGQKRQLVVWARSSSSVLKRRRLLSGRMSNEAMSLLTNFISFRSRIHFREWTTILGLEFEWLDSILPFSVSFERTQLCDDPFEQTTASLGCLCMPLPLQVSFRWSTDLYSTISNNRSRPLEWTPFHQ
jgi:hypothetical protein